VTVTTDVAPAPAYLTVHVQTVETSLSSHHRLSRRQSGCPGAVADELLPNIQLVIQLVARANVGVRTRNALLQLTVHTSHQCHHSRQKRTAQLIVDEVVSVYSVYASLV